MRDALERHLDALGSIHSVKALDAIRDRLDSRPCGVEHETFPARCDLDAGHEGGPSGGHSSFGRTWAHLAPVAEAMANVKPRSAKPGKAARRAVKVAS